MLLKVGIFDVDDILLNTTGGILGYLFYAICNALVRRYRLKKKKKRRS
jgi:glycopeptide antibiotics resistance protein